MTPLVRKRLTLPADFISCPACLAWVERLIANTADYVEVAVDFNTGRTTIEYPAPVLDPLALLAAA